MLVRMSGGKVPSITLLLLLMGAALLSLSPTVTGEPSATPDESEPGALMLQTIEGRISVEGAKSEDWVWRTKVSLDGGKYYGYLKANGEFEIHGVVPGSYLVEVVSPNYVFEPARIDISSKSGKVRARKVNTLKASSVQHLPYPLKFKAGKQAEFFEKREPWSILSTLKNPMVYLLVGPMLLMLVLPRLLKGMDPEAQKEAQETMNAFQPQGGGMPSIEEWLTKFFGGGGAGGAPKKTSSSAGTRRGKSR